MSESEGTFSLHTKFPLLAAGLTCDGDVLVVGGGGGSSKTGVKNSLKLCPIQSAGIGEYSTHDGVRAP